ncbi:hypothetical protein Tco_0240889 [Tanacetum coccineum]
MSSIVITLALRHYVNSAGLMLNSRSKQRIPTSNSTVVLSPITTGELCLSKKEIGALLLRPQQVIIGGEQDQTPIIIVDLILLELIIKLRTWRTEGIFDTWLLRAHDLVTKDTPWMIFEVYKGGSVTFGGSKGYITGKGKIRVGNLDFDSVSFVKELGHFNLFSISQICDKHYKVLFTKTECLVVSPDFQMADENQTLLKVPRQHNMYV